MKRFRIPKWVKEHSIEFDDLDQVPKGVFRRIKKDLEKFNPEDPEVSIVIPAYNEEKDLLKTLSSLSQIKTKYRTEIIVANNNSTDRTQMILDLCGVKSIFKEDQGISYARQAGMEAAKGKYILSADADSIYPPNWVDPYVDKLKDTDVSCVYGRYSFIPSNKSSRFILGLYEIIAETVFKFRKNEKEAINVMGFNSAFRKEDAMNAGGYNHFLQRTITERSEDGWMALMLASVGQIALVDTDDVRVWTSDRRLLFDGGLYKAFFKRSKREIKRYVGTSIFKVPDWVNDILDNYESIDSLSAGEIEELQFNLQKFNVDDPEVTIAIPVYNEEKDIVKMLSSLARMESRYRTELLIVNNNSKDRTREILDLLKVKTIDEPKQGISFARQTGLMHAKGEYFLNADGDSIYPPGWIDTYVEVLKNPEIACAYGKYSFIPSEHSSRMVLGIYEIISRMLFKIRRKKMDFFNVLGFNFAFRRQDGIDVGGFNTMRKRWSDGWMAMTLQEKGRIELVKDFNAKVWTSDRRLVYDGGLLRAVIKRLRKEMGRYFGLLKIQENKFEHEI